MIFKSFLLTLAIALSLSTSLPAFGQSGYYVIPPELQGIVTIPFLDSIRADADLNKHQWVTVDLLRMGKNLWHGGSSKQWLPNNPNKIKFTSFTCFENGWVKSEAVYDTLTNTQDYVIEIPSYDTLSSVFWTESIGTIVIDSSAIIINSPLDVNVEIHKAFDNLWRVADFFVEGNGDDQTFQVNLESGSLYVVVFRNSENQVVFIKRIRG